MQIWQANECDDYIYEVKVVLLQTKANLFFIMFDFNSPIVNKLGFNPLHYRLIGYTHMFIERKHMLNCKMTNYD